jgi:holo-[acyl-carrier protein] synthase
LFEEKELIYKINEFDDLLKNDYGITSQEEYSKIFTEKEFEDKDYKYIKRKLFGKYLIKKIISGYLNSKDLIEIEVLNDEMGKPQVFLKNDLYIKDFKINVSISHSKNWVAVLVIFEY